VLGPFILRGSLRSHLRMTENGGVGALSRPNTCRSMLRSFSSDIITLQSRHIRSGDRRMLDRLKKLINGEIAFGFFLATIFWIAVLGWVTSFQSTPQEQEACYQSAAKSGRDTSECKTFWEKTTSEPVAFFSLVLAFSTVGMWLATIGLYRSAEKQIRTSRQIAKDQAQQTRISDAQAIRAANAADQSAQAAVAAERADSTSWFSGTISMTFWLPSEDIQIVPPCRSLSSQKLNTFSKITAKLPG
jgi:hypothetical protein